MHWLCNWSVGKFYLQLNLSSPHNWRPAFGPLQGLSSGYCEKSRSWLLQGLSFMLWNKTHILWLDKKKINIIFLLCPLHSFLLPTVHCISVWCINQSSPIGRNTCSTIKSNILPASRQFLKIYHSFLVL